MTTLNGRYQTMALLETGQGIETYLGTDAVSHAQVVIKTASSADVGPTAQLRLEHAADVLRRHRDAHLGAVLDVGRTDGLFYLVAPFVPGVTLARRLERGPLDVRDTVAVGRGLLSALAVVHDEGLIHRDVRPSNIVLDAAVRPRVVTLIDFGPARSVGFVTSPRDVPLDAIVYMAPELAGSIHFEVGERADLYSAGVVLYQCLTARTPFRGASVGAILQEQLTVPPPHIRGLGVVVPRSLDEMIQRLLRIDPRDRYQSAAAALADLDEIAAAMDRGQPDAELVVGAHDRRRTLTEPSFVGRARELADFDAALQAAARGEGRLVLVRGESGSGKSRLLAEMAVRSALSGAWVLRGEGTANSAQRPFQILDGVVHDIVIAGRSEPALQTMLRTSLREYADELCAVFPELHELLVPGEVQLLGLEADAEVRSVQAFVALLDALGSAQRTAVILLDDCQWADQLSLKLIRAWHRAHLESGAGHRVAVVAASRTDDVGGDEAFSQITQAVDLSLPPLDGDEVARLVESAAGAVPADAVEVVRRLSEGNPLIAIAVLEGLVECGALLDSPQGWQVDPSAMENAQSSQRAAAFLAFRVDRLPTAALDLLSVAAVLGKKFDARLAADLAGQTATEAMEGILEARRRHLLWLEPRGERCQFSHDRVRDAFLDRLSAEDQKRLHRLAAIHLTQGGPQLGDCTFDIAYHFDAAGDPVSALPYAMRAASMARSRCALEIAEREYRIAEHALEGAEKSVQRQVREGLGDVLALRGRYEEAETQLTKALALSASALARAQMQGKLADVLFKRGSVEAAGESIERALEMLRRRVPKTRLGILLSTLSQAFRQAIHSVLPRRLVATGRRAHRESDLLAAYLYSRLAYAYWFYRGQTATFWAHLHELNIAERHPPSRELAQAYSEHALAMTGLPRFFFPRGFAYARRGLAMRRAMGDLWGQGQSLNFLGALLYAAARYPEARERFRQAIEAFRRAGDRWEANIAGYHVALCLYRTGALREAVEECRRVFRVGAEIGDRHATTFVLEVWSKATGGDVPAELVAAALRSSRNDAFTHELALQAEGVRLLGAGDTPGAIEALRDGERLVRAAQLRNEYVAQLPVWLGHVMRVAAVSSAASLGIPLPRRLKRAEKVTRRGWKIARRYRGNLPMVLRERAALLAARGAERRARRAITKSLAVANAQGEHFEYAQSLLVRGELGRMFGWPGSDSMVADARARLSALGGDFILRERAVRGRHESDEPSPASISLIDRFERISVSGRHIASALDAPEIYEAACNAGASLLRGELCAVFVLDGTDLRLELSCGTGDPSVFGLDSVRSAMERGTVEALRDDAPEMSTERPAHAGWRSVLFAPIVVRGQVKGCLCLRHSHVGSLFGEDELRLAGYIVTLAGASLEKAEAFAQVQALTRSLEERVADRTAQLVAANDELNKKFKELREAQELLVQSGKMAAVGTLVAGLSHEINNPISVIVGRSQLLLRTLSADDPARASMIVIERQARRCADLVRTLLDFSRRSTSERVRMDVGSLLSRVAELVIAQAGDRGVTLRIASVPPGTGQVSVCVTEMESALLNLVGNALDASSRGGVVEMGASRHGRDGRPGIDIYVRDHGPGIPPDVLPHIFDPFFTTKPVGQGTGLGLSMSRQIVDAHGGGLFVESRPGEGTTMRIWLPLDIIKEHEEWRSP